MVFASISPLDYACLAPEGLAEKRKKGIKGKKSIAFSIGNFQVKNLFLFNSHIKKAEAALGRWMCVKGGIEE